MSCGASAPSACWKAPRPRRTEDRRQRSEIRCQKSAPTSLTLQLSNCFGDYELLEEIARGGMGVVYKARQVSLNRLVALKMILGGQLAGKQEVLRFRAEAEAAANLRHPNIVAIYETGEHEGLHYFSMDYVAGQNLTAMVRKSGPLQAQRAARYARLIAAAIHYAHDQSTLHRDLKPSNVIIDEADQPRVTDFGLAKRVRGDFGLTVTGQVLGTPNYMPPEQCGAASERETFEAPGATPSTRSCGRRSKVGPWSDVYGVGAILYYLLTGRPPFQAETIEEVLTLLVSDQEPVSHRLLNPSVPRDLETITLKCHNRGVTATAFSPDGRLVATASVDGTVRIWHPDSGRQPSVFTNFSGPVTSVAFHPDGRSLAAGSADSTARVLEVLTGRELNVFRGHTNHVTAVAFSRDGKRLAVGGRDGVTQIWNVLPWRTEELPGDASLDYEERIQLYQTERRRRCVIREEALKLMVERMKSPRAGDPSESRKIP